MGIVSDLSARRALHSQLAEAENGLRDLLEQRQAAYSSFNSAADPLLLEASILELSAAQSKYEILLRRVKALKKEVSDADSHPVLIGLRRRRADRPAAEAAEKASEMGM